MNVTKSEIANPFDIRVVNSPLQPPYVDVPEIHQVPVAVCCREFELIAGGHRSILFHCQAGSGKTHLLARFRSWIGARALFVAVRMETAPGWVWRCVRKQMAEYSSQRFSRGVFASHTERWRCTRPGGGLNSSGETG